MNQAVQLISNSIQGCIITDGKCQASRGAAAAALLSCSNGGHKLFWGANTLLKSSPLHCPTAFCITCKSNNSHGRNPNFSRHQRGSLRGRNQQHLERESLETLDETDTLPSKNGSLFSLSTNQRHPATATPGRREMEMVQLFRKVQTQLRERAALKEEKKIEASQQEESGTVDSFLNLLRKHSVAQGKGKKSGHGEEFNLDQPEEETNTNFFSSSNIVTTSDDVIEPNPVPFSRPASEFRRRSPVPRVIFQPFFSVEKDGVDEPEPGLVALEEPGEKSLDGLSDSSDDDNDDDTNAVVVEASIAEIADLASLKLTELKDLAKSRGLKGYSKLKKGELVEFLSRDCS